jgi:hypothetical protein
MHRQERSQGFSKGVPASGKTCRPCGSFFSPVFPSSRFFSKGLCPCPGEPPPLAKPLCTMPNGLVIPPLSSQIVTDIVSNVKFTVGIYKITNEGTSPSVTRRFQSDLYQFVELDETRRSLKELVPIRCPSRVMTVLLNFRPLRTHM